MTKTAQAAEQDQTLYASLARAQGKMKNPAKNATNPHFKNKYADLSAIRDAVIPALSAEGIAMTQVLRRVDGESEVITTLYKGEYTIQSFYPINTNLKPQQVGSEITYAKRYSLAAICGVAADEDDDGSAANDAPRQAARPVNQPPKPQQKKDEAFQWCKKVFANAQSNKDMTAAQFMDFTKGDGFRTAFTALDEAQRKQIGGEQARIQEALAAKEAPPVDKALSNGAAASPSEIDCYGAG